METKATRRTRNGRNWARTGLLGGIVVAVLIVAFGQDIANHALIAVGALILLPLIGWLLGLTIPVDD